MTVADNFCKATHESAYAIVDTLNEMFSQFIKNLEMLKEEIETYTTQETTEIEIEHNTVYKSSIRDWMIVFELLKIPIGNKHSECNE